MSLAWEVTDEDVLQVVRRHGKTVGLDSEELTAVAGVVMAESGTIEKAVLHYSDFDQQCAAALSQIEDILIKDGYLDAPKLFTCTK